MHASNFTTFSVNRNLQDTCPVYGASGKSETNASTMMVSGTGQGLWCWSYTTQTLKSRLPSKSSSVNTSSEIDLTVTRNERRDI